MEHLAMYQNGYDTENGWLDKVEAELNSARPVGDVYEAQKLLSPTMVRYTGLHCLINVRNV